MSYKVRGYARENDTKLSILVNPKGTVINGGWTTETLGPKLICASWDKTIRYTLIGFMIVSDQSTEDYNDLFNRFEREHETNIKGIEDKTEPE